MSGGPGRVSLFITLGIAAIDMLTCAFVSMVVLFILFLVPKQAGGASEREDVLLLHWSVQGAKGAVIGLDLERDGARSMVWSDSPKSAEDVCALLSKAPTTKNACYLASSGSDASDQDGILMISRPLSGQWSVQLYYSDTADNGNAGNYAPIDLKVTMIRQNVIELSSKVTAGGLVDLVNVDGSQAAAVKDLLQID